MEVIEKRFKKFQLFSMLIALFSLVIGVLFLGFEKHLTIETIYYVVGCIIVISGLFSLVKYFYDGLANDVYKLELVNGIVLLILGGFMLLYKFDNLFKVIGVFFGIYYLFMGFMKGYYTYNFFNSNEEVYPLFLMLTILTIVMGVLSLFNPFSSFMLISRLITIFLVVGSVFELMAASLFRKRAKNILKMFE